MTTALLFHNVFCPKPHLRAKPVFRPLTAPCPRLSICSISPNYVLKPLPLFVVNAVLACIETALKSVSAELVLAVLLLNNPHDALVASGGRMGGSSFSSGSRSSSSSSTYSSPSRSSSSSYSSPSRSSSSSYSSSNSSSDPLESNELSYSESSPAPAPGVATAEAKAGGGFNFFLIGFVAVALLCWYSVWKDYQREIQETSIIKLQVGLLGMARSFQKDLDEIAKVADTSTTKGLSYILTETTLALLRHPDFCISGYSYVDVKRSIEDGEKRFNMLSIEERGKFDEETLVNVNNIKRQSTSTRRSNGLNNEYIVITILVAAEGVHKLPVINGSADLKVALQKLGSIPANKTLAVEVLWTPQDENDTLTERELLEDYPLLRPL